MLPDGLIRLNSPQTASEVEIRLSVPARSFALALLRSVRAALRMTTCSCAGAGAADERRQRGLTITGGNSSHDGYRNLKTPSDWLGR